MSDPSVGRIVHYQLTPEDAEAITRRIDDGTRHIAEHRERADGSIVHIGNDAVAGQVLPMLIVRVWSPTLVNGQVFVDGNFTLWVPSVEYSEGPEFRHWFWPQRV